MEYLSKQLHQKILEARGEMKSPLQNQGVNSKRQSINILTPASQIPIKKTSKKKAIWEMREFKFLKESPIKFMLYGLWHILNILNLEVIFFCLFSFFHLFYFRFLLIVWKILIMILIYLKTKYFLKHFSTKLMLKKNFLKILIEIY